MTIETNSFETIHFRVLDHSFETTFIWDHDIWDHVHLRPIHLRPRSFETTFIWDHIHLRPQSFETTSFETTFIWDHFIWDHIHLRLHSLVIAFILRHVEVKLFWFTVYHFLWSAFHFCAGDLKFSNVTIHLKFCKVAPFRVQGWLTLVCKCTRTQGQIKGGSGGI